MEFNLFAGWIGGFVGAVAMTLLMKMGTSMGMSNMPPMPVIQGAMFTDDESAARKIGMVTHLIVMGTLVFGTVYAALFAAFGTAGWLAGVVIGLVHAVVAGAIGFPMMGSSHPRMEGVAAFSGDSTYEAEPGSLRVAAPGFFGINYGRGTPMGLLMGHAVYGLVVALIYGAFV